MSTYEVGAFEALEWAWKMLLLEKSKEDIDAKSQIIDMLFKLGSGNYVDYRQQINEIRNLA
jgi:hypothetical protein